MEVRNMGIELCKGAIEGPVTAGDRGPGSPLWACSENHGFRYCPRESFDVVAEFATQQGFIRNDHVFAATLLIAIMSNKDMHTTSLLAGRPNSSRSRLAC